MNQQFLTELKAVTAENRIFTDEPIEKTYDIPCGGRQIFSAAKGNRACGGHPSVQEV